MHVTWVVGVLSSAANGKGYTGMFSLLVAPSFPPSVCLCLCICLWAMLGKNMLTISITFSEEVGYDTRSKVQYVGNVTCNSLDNGLSGANLLWNLDKGEEYFPFR